MRKWLCLLVESPYMYPLLADRLSIVENLTNISDEIVCFFYLDGIHQINSHQLPKNFENIEQIFTRIHQNHPKVRFLACSRCTAARGYVDLAASDFENSTFLSQKLVEFVEIVSIRKLGEILAHGFQIVHI